MGWRYTFGRHQCIDGIFSLESSGEIAKGMAAASN